MADKKPVVIGGLPHKAMLVAALGQTTPAPGDMSARHAATLKTMIHQSDDGAICICAECRALKAAIAALSALPAAGESWEADGIKEALQLGRLKGHEVFYTTPQPSAAEVPSPLGDWYEPAIAAVGAQGDGWQDKVLEILRPLLDTGDSRTADDKAVAIYAILANAAPAATPTDGGEGS